MSRLQLPCTCLTQRRSDTYKTNLVERFTAFAFERLCEEQIRPIVSKVFDWEKAGEAHEYMEGSANIGNLILTGM